VALDSSFDFKDFEKKEEELILPEESVSSLSRIFQISLSVILGNLGILPYLILIVVLNGILISYNSLNFDFERFINEAANNNQAYILDFAKHLGTVYMINLIASVLFLLLHNTFYVAVVVKSKDGFADKVTMFFSIFFRKGLHLLIAIILKSVVILVGTLMFVIPGIIFWLGMLFIEYIIIFEDKGFFESWNKSSELMAGVKSNFITFMSIASIAIIPVIILKIFYNFDMQVAQLAKVFAINLDLIISILVEMCQHLLYGAYFIGTCLLYIKRTKLLEEQEDKQYEALNTV
jgi:hypothetical protein